MLRYVIPYLLYFAPVIIGIIVALVNKPSVETHINKFTDWLSSRKQKITSESGKFNKYVTRPILWFALQIKDWTEGIANSGFKSGLRIALYLYLTALFLYIFAMFVALLIAIIVFGIIMWILDKSSSDSSETVYTTTEKKQRVFGKDYYETKDKNGKVVSTSEEKEKIFGGKYTETKDSKGKVISTSEGKEKLFGGQYVETKNTDGKVVSTSEGKEKLFGGQYVETKDADGKVIATSEVKEKLFGDKYVETKKKE